ncbi:MAG: hypothetical protein K2K22_03260, partial [Muribaculaceae bacterium]|nr:hypothetical protein [Muribaculaceae bacterium]
MSLKHLLTYSLLALCLGTAAAEEPERTPAFPGAEGWGRYVTGGRGGKVVHVTNLNDSGEGSLRAAIDTDGARTIVFDISGTIYLKSGLGINKGDVTIAGQTAPGDGICIADAPVTINCSNVIMRYIRLRPGNRNGGEFDALEAKDRSRIIIDHCSLSWSVDETCSVYGNRFSTVQWCLIAQSLRYGGHSKDAHGYGAMMGGEGASYHHNLLMHHDSRCPRICERPASGPRDTTDFRNNVMYNWAGQGCYGAENMYFNMVNNYYKPGPATASRPSNIQKRICGITVNSTVGDPMYHVWAKVYVDGNFNSKYADVSRDNFNYGIWAQIDESARNNPSVSGLRREEMQLREPVKYYYVSTHSAADAFERVLDFAGASLHRDSHDELMASDARSGVATYTGSGSGNGKGIIDSPYDNKPADADDSWSPWPLLARENAPADSDRDGMPDMWEVEMGLDPQNPEDRNIRNEEGYTMLEVYINSLVEHITEAQNEGAAADGYIERHAPVMESYTLSNETRIDGSWSFDGDFSMSNSMNGSYYTSGAYIGVSRDICHTITLPERVQVDAVSITGHTRYSSATFGDASLVELAGSTFESGDYSLAKGAEDSSFKVILDKPATGSMTMTWTGNIPLMMITLHTSAA